VEALKRSNVIVFASVAAAAAGIAVVVAIARWRERRSIGDCVETGLRGVQDVLSDCYQKISEIENSLPVAPNIAVTGRPAPLRDVKARSMSNGNPAWGS